MTEVGQQDHQAAAPFRILQAAVWALGAVVSFLAMAVAGREAGGRLDTFEIMTYRSLIGLAVVVTIAALLRRLSEVRRDRLGLHLVRNVFHFAGQNLWFYALATIPLAQVAALEFSYPIWVALAAPLVLGERLTLRRAAAVAIGFAGVLIILRPGVLPLSAGTLAALCCAFGFAGSALATKRLTGTETTLGILFWLALMQTAMGLACALGDGAMRLPDAQTLPLVIVIGLAGLSAHYCLTNALSLAPATLIVPVEFLRLPATVLTGMALYAEPLDPFVLAGGAVILGAIVLNLWEPRRKRRNAA